MAYFISFSASIMVDQRFFSTGCVDGASIRQNVCGTNLLPHDGSHGIRDEELLPPDCEPADSDQIIQLQLRASAFPRGLELFLHKARIVFLALGLEPLLQPE